MSDLHRDKTLALAALFQAATLADALAWRGHCDPAALEASLNSVLVMDTDDVGVIYGNNVRGLHSGLQALEQTFLEPLRGGHPRQVDIMRYALGIIQVERQLAKSPDLLETLRQRLEMAAQQRKHFDSLTTPAMLNNLGGIYVDTANCAFVSRSGATRNSCKLLVWLNRFERYCCRVFVLHGFGID